MAENKEPDMALPPASSVVMKAIDATTFTEMERFVKDLESRPIERLLKDLPDLADLPATKVSLVSYVIAAKVPPSRPTDSRHDQGKRPGHAEPHGHRRAPRPRRTNVRAAKVG
jgi:hypothetical protein